MLSLRCRPPITIGPLRSSAPTSDRFATNATRRTRILFFLFGCLFFELSPRRQDLDEDEEDDEGKDEEAQGDEEPFEATQGYLVRGEAP